MTTAIYSEARDNSTASVARAKPPGCGCLLRFITISESLEATSQQTALHAVHPRRQELWKCRLRAMSFGGPGGGQKSAKPIPPERGSFPLDHDGECKPIIADYLRCLRRVKGTNDQECRMMAKEYLKCRMENNLMAPDEMKNLGFAEEEKTEPIPNHAGGATAHKVRDDGKKIS